MEHVGGAQLWYASDPHKHSLQGMHALETPVLLHGGTGLFSGQHAGVQRAALSARCAAQGIITSAMKVGTHFAGLPGALAGAIAQHRATV